MLPHLRRVVRDQHGASLIEYALICCVLALVAAAGFGTAGQAISNVMDRAVNALN
jgi:Flp pilus assembly pilin Flp